MLYFHLLQGMGPPFYIIGHPSYPKEVPSFLSYFKTLSSGSALGIEPTTSCSAVKHSTNWANPVWVKQCKYYFRYMKWNTPNSTFTYYYLFFFIFKIEILNFRLKSI